MASTSSNDIGGKKERILEENKGDVTLLHDMLLDAENPTKAGDDDLRSGATPAKLDPSGLARAPLLTVSDIVNSNMEGIDETDQIRRLEKRQSNQDAFNESLLPGIPDEFLGNLEENDDDQNGILDEDDCRNPGLQGAGTTHTTLSELTVHHGAEQDSQLEEGDCRNTGLQGIGTTRTTGTTGTSHTTLSELTRQYARLSAPDENPDLSMRSFTLDESIARGMADLYYENAAKIMPEDIESGRDGIDESSGNNDSSRKKKCLEILRVKRRIAANLEIFKEFIEPHKKRLRKIFKNVVLYIMVPSLIMAIFLFYVFGNPPNGYALIPCHKEIEMATTNRKLQNLVEAAAGFLNIPIAESTEAAELTTPSPTLSPSMLPTKLKYTLSDRKNSTLCHDKESSIAEASVSWWFLFIGIRQAITFCLAVLTETIFIDFCMFRTRFVPKLIGTKLALAVAQSKGWPCTLLFWAVIDFLLLYGEGPFARHWIYYQDFSALMNETNPSGGITGHPRYRRILCFAIGLSVATTLKRTMMANFVGQRVVVNYKLDLMKLVKKLLIVGDVANLSKATQSSTKSILFQRTTSLGREVMGDLENSTLDMEYDDERDKSVGEGKPFDSIRNAIGSPRKKRENSSIFITQIYEYLDEWEEPELQGNHEKVSTKDVLHFRRAVEFINSEYPFSPAFGRATTREECARASQRLFEKLLKRDEDILSFDILCKTTRNPDGTINKKKMMELVKLFRPNRDGHVTKLEFVKSIDSVYKRLRLILANINSSSQIDRAYGQITNGVFFVVVTLIGLSVYGLDVTALLITLAGLLVSFAFMIGSASSKYVEGILLILVRKPYDIGDKVCFMDANADVDDFGPPGGGWIVENVDLYTTTVRMGTTREYATFTNGSLANSRILNLKRSEKPNIYMYLKFTMNITQEQLDEFRRRIVVFIKDRPREWIKLVSLRCTDFETEQQYLKFALIVQHRESWQSFGTIQVSKSAIYIHSLHLMKELKMNYTAPELPVHLTGNTSKALVRDFFDSDMNDNISASKKAPSRSLFDNNSPYGNKSMPPGVLHDPSPEIDRSDSTGVLSTTMNVGAKTANDGSLVRRNASRSDNGGNRDSSEGERNGQQTNVAEESILRRGSPGVSSLAVSRPQNISKRQVSFATEEQRRGKKNKDT